MRGMWLLMAVLSAFFSGVTAILAKCGLRKTDSDVATALRTTVVLAFSWVMVAFAGSAEGLTAISGRSLTFLLLSGLATGLSWICYFKALALGDVSRVAPIDKSSTVMTVLLAIFLFAETQRLAVKLIGTAILTAGILLLLAPGRPRKASAGKGWMFYAVLSAVFAALTSILAKIGIEGVASDLATAIRTAVVLVLAWGIVFAKGKQRLLRTLDKRELGYIALTGVATGCAWLCYYSAISTGIVSVVVPIDKLSIVVTAAFSCLFLKERLTRRMAGGLGLVVAGTLMMAI